MSAHARTMRRRQRGAGLIETMVGILIGILVVLVVYNMLAVAEGYKRMTEGYADAQITGLISQFVAGQDASNGGNGLTSAFPDLMNCTKDEGGVAYYANLINNDTNTLKPFSALIFNGQTANDSDAFISFQGGSPHVVWPVALRPIDGLAANSTVAAGGTIEVQSPNGFMTPAKASIPTAASPFWVVAMANDGTGACTLIQITNATPAAAVGDLMDDTGNVQLTQGAPATSIPYKAVPQNSAGTGSLLLNLGPVNNSTRIRYEVNPPGATASERNQLLTTNCLAMTGCAGVARNPIAQNVVWMKVQYGINTNPPLANGTLDATVNCWTPADNSVPACLVDTTSWDPATLIKAGEAGGPATNALNRIVAVRIGLVVRSDEPDLKDPALYTSPATTVDGQPGTRQLLPPVYLFNCAANTSLACQSRVQVPAPQVLADGWRYRTYEAVIPLRNSIFNATLPP